MLYELIFFVLFKAINLAFFGISETPPDSENQTTFASPSAFH